jgi:hypothetical protein
MDVFDSAMIAPIVVAAAAALSFRVVPLACDGDRLAISGGGVLHMAADASCAKVVPGRAIAIALDDANGVSIVKLDASAKAASEIPKEAYAFAPAGTAASGKDVLVSIEVTIPAYTAPNSSIYLSTERSGFSPAEVQMNQLDARRYRSQIPLRDGAQLAFRVTRGTFSTIEREANGRLPPPHVLVAHAGVSVSVTVAAWADDF